MQYKYSDLHEIYLVFLSQFNTLASEVKCLRVIERRDLSNEQNTFKSKTIFYHNKTRLKPERATRPIPKRGRPLYATATRPIPKRRRPLYATATRSIPKRRRPLYATATRPIPKRRRPLYATATRPIPKRRRPLYATATRPIPKRRRPLYATATTQILNLSNLLKGSDIKRTSRRTALLKGRNTRTIQLPLRHLKGIGIGMTPLSDWLNVLPRGSGIAGVTELPLPPKGM